jgi:hypothetical protein
MDLKKLLPLGIISAAIYGGIKYFQAKKLLESFRYQIISYSPPSIESANVVFPVKIQFDNNSDIGVTIDAIMTDVLVDRGQGFELAGTSRPAESIEIGPNSRTTHTIRPEISLAKAVTVFGTSLYSMILKGITLSGAVKIKIRATVYVAGSKALTAEEMILGTDTAQLSGSELPIYLQS